MDITLPRILPGPGSLPDLQLSRPQGATPSLTDPRTTGLSGIADLAGIAPAAASSAQGLAESFGSVLAQAMQGVNKLHQSADLDASRLAAGESVDLHQVMIGMEKANLSFGLALQVRNKLIEAYQEVMRMQM